MSTRARVATGLDCLAAAGYAPLRGRRVGVICNPTTVDGRLRHIADLLKAAPGVELAALFGPEHGVRAAAQDMIAVGGGVDPDTGVPVHSLYGQDEASLRPDPAWLDGLDVLVFDVQDVGSRYYTFAATMLYCMEVAAERGVAFWVLDRPNPLGGVAVEGPTVEAGFDSFVGAYPLPIRHGMTVGELARLFQGELRLDLALEVVACEGLTRGMQWPETGLDWISPSPNMPSYVTALVYPGGCLIEGTNLSEGRGTTRPFELWGAPWNLEASRRLVGAFEADEVAERWGVRTRATAFQPVFHKHAGAVCHGVQPHVRDAERFSGLRFFLAALSCLRATAPSSEELLWRTETYEFVTEPIAIDLLFGSSREREWIDGFRGGQGWSLDAVTEHSRTWEPHEAAFRERREPYLLYS